MKLASLPRKVARGLPYLGKEIRAIISDHTPIFLAVPRTVHLWRGAPCNARCIMCEFGIFQGEALRAISHSPFTDDLMPRALDEIHELCGRGTLVSYMGGEPTICKGIMNWVEQAGRLGLDFRFTTNGYAMTEEMADRFVLAGLFNIGVSLESFDPKINETVRPHPNGTAKTVRAIELLLQARERHKKHLSINVKTVLTDLNLESFLEIVRRYARMDGVMCTPQAYESIHDTPPATRNLLYIRDVNRLERVANEIRQLKRAGYTIHVTEQGLQDMIKLYRDDTHKTSSMHGQKMEMAPSEPACNIGTDNLWIQDGSVKLCPYYPPLGNMLTDKATLKQMWQAKLARRVRADTRACRRLCTIACLRRTPLHHKVSLFLKIA